MDLMYLKLKVIPLGGIGEVGKNLTVVEYGEDIIIIDCGLGFPDDDMLGIDLVIPDVTYLEKNCEKVRAIFLTHGHDSNMGAMADILYDMPDLPVYATKFTMEVLKDFRGFLAEFENQSLVAQESEIRNILLLPYEQAYSLFPYENTRQVLAAAHAFLTK